MPTPEHTDPFLAQSASHAPSRRTVLAGIGAATSLLVLPVTAAPSAYAASDTWAPPVGTTDGTVLGPSGIAHPGILTDRDQLNLIRDMVRRGKEPWTSAFEQFRQDLAAGTEYELQGPVADTPNDKGAAAYRLQADGTAAQYQAVMWYITSDPAFLATALRIIRAWAPVVTTMGDGLRGATGIAAMNHAAEILRHTSESGWTDADTAAYTAMLQVVLQPRSNGIQDPRWFMNQGGMVTQALLTSAVFLDDADLYARFMEWVTTGVNPTAGSDIAIARQIATNGQVSEMGRDQPHATYDVDLPAAMAATAYIQNRRGNLGATAIDLFTYLDNRILSGAEFFATYNLGYDVPWTPVVYGAGTYGVVASGGRGALLGNASLVYHHYKHVVGVSMAQYPHLTRFKELSAAAAVTGHALSNLLFTPAAAAAPDRGTGQPGPLASNTPDPRYGRFYAANLTATSGENDIRTDPWLDSDGSRMIVRDILVNGWIEYQDFDFGTVPAQVLLMSAGVNSTVPTKVSIHLDSLTGELIGTGAIAPTGWYTNWSTNATRLTRALTGKHTLYMQFTGSNNVYHWQGGVDWFKVASGSAKLKNNAVDAPVQQGTSPGPSGTGLTLGTGNHLGYQNFDFDNGSLFLTLRAVSGPGTVLELRAQSPTGAAVATYDLPDTKGDWQQFSRPQTKEAILGISDFYLVQTAGDPLSLDWFQYGAAAPVFSAVDAETYYAGVRGTTRLRNGDHRGDPSYLVLGAGSATTFPPIAVGYKSLGVEVRSAHGAHVQARVDKQENTPVAEGDVPPTPGSGWRNVNLAAVASAAGGQLILSTDQRVELRVVQPDPVNEDSPVVSIDAPATAEVGQPLTIAVSATDPVGHDVTLKALDLPKGARFNRRTSVITWTPGASQLGVATLSILADNGTTLGVGTKSVTVSAT